MSENDRQDQRQDQRHDQRPDSGPGQEDMQEVDAGRTAAEAESMQAELEQDASEQESDAGEPRGSADAEIQRLTEALARTQAEMVNHERRLEREMDKARKFALERVMRDFIQVLDSLDQALAATNHENAESAQEGLQLTRKLALKVLEAHGLETLNPKGERFDANWHEAMTAVPTEDAEPDTVFDVLQAGYALHGRLLRPARVIVAKAP